MTDANPQTTAQAPPLWQLLQTAARQLEGVWRGESLTRLLETVPAPLRPATQALSFELMRQLGRAQSLRRQLAPRRPAPAVDALLCTALALLLREPAPAYAAHTLVDQAVEAAKRQPATRKQAAFINACLRRWLRDGPTLRQALQADPLARFNHPRWWVERLQHDHPTHWAALLAANQHPAAMDLRVNLQRNSRADYLHELHQHGIEARALPQLGAAAVRLQRPLPVPTLPGHAQGRVSVQSATAQRAAPLLLEGLAAQPLRVLDACAAPGGKTAHLLELMPQAQVTALELQAGRSTRIHDNLQRLGLQAQVRVADAGQPAAWWDGQPFDAILLDAPCSASGIVRRHPDVRWLRREGDIAQLAAEQDRLLAALWPLLAPGGRLLYCTCSVFVQEGSARVRRFIRHHGDALELPAPGHVLGALDDNGDCDEDGFFYALLHKRPA